MKTDAMPAPSIDNKARMRKRSKATAQDLRKLVGEDNVRLTEDGVRVNGRGVWASIEWGSLDGEGLRRYLLQSFEKFTDWMKSSETRGNERAAAVYSEFRSLTAKLSGKSVEEMEREVKNGNDGIRYRFADNEDDFDSIRERAVSERGLVMPGLNEKEVRVVDVPQHDFAGDKPISQAKRWAKENLTGKYMLTDSAGEVVEYEISGRAIDKFLSYSATAKSDGLSIHLSALKKLPEIIKPSVEGEVHPSYNKEEGRRNVSNEINKEILIHRFYGAIQQDGRLYRVKTTILEYRDENKPKRTHSYEVSKIEVIPERTETTSIFGAQSYASDEMRTIQTTKLLKDVEKSYDPGVKLWGASEKQTRERNGEGAYSDADVSFESDPWSRAWGENLRSKKQQKAFAEKERERMRSTVERLAGQLGLEVSVVEDGSTLLEGDKERGERKSKSKGWYDTATGRITVVVGNQ